MTRAKGDRRLTIGRRAVAVAIVTDLLEQAAAAAGESFDFATLADEVVSLASDSEYKMRSDQLVLTLDASYEAPDREDAMRSTPEDHAP